MSIDPCCEIRFSFLCPATPWKRQTSKTHERNSFRDPCPSPGAPFRKPAHESLIIASTAGQKLFVILARSIDNALFLDMDLSRHGFFEGRLLPRIRTGSPNPSSRSQSSRVPMTPKAGGPSYSSGVLDKVAICQTSRCSGVATECLCHTRISRRKPCLVSETLEAETKPPYLTPYTQRPQRSHR